MLLLFVLLPYILCQAVREVLEVKIPSSAYIILYSFYMYVSKHKFYTLLESQCYRGVAQTKIMIYFYLKSKLVVPVVLISCSLPQFE